MKGQKWIGVLIIKVQQSEIKFESNTSVDINFTSTDCAYWITK